MKLRASRSTLRGRVAIPGSKSHTIRAVALAGLAKGVSTIEAPLNSSDTLSAVNSYRKLGAQIDCGEVWTVRGVAGRPSVPDDVIDVGNSGTTLRFAIGSAALLAQGAAVFTGDEQIRSRPVGPLLDSLNQLGAQCLSTRNNGKTPVVVRGPMRGGQTSIEAVTSQYLSSLLVNTPLAPEDTRIEVTKLNEAPYVEITLRYLDEQGIKYQRDEAMTWFEVAGGQSYQSFHKRIPADFSSATFFLCAAAVLPGSDLVLEGLDFSDAQGDKAVVTMLQEMGANIAVEANEVRIQAADLHGAELDLNATPDALPALAVTAALAEGPTRFYNVAQARLKETDRIAVMATELRKIGVQVDEQEDGMTITPAAVRGAELRGYGDHRVVMALSIAGMASAEGCRVDTADAVNITFPDYVDLMGSVGGRLRMEH